MYALRTLIGDRVMTVCCGCTGPIRSGPDPEVLSPITRTLTLNRVPAIMLASFFPQIFLASQEKQRK
jgi:hypothetical protein